MAHFEIDFHNPQIENTEIAPNIGIIISCIHYIIDYKLFVLNYF